MKYGNIIRHSAAKDVRIRDLQEEVTELREMLGNVVDELSSGGANVDAFRDIWLRLIKSRVKELDDRKGQE